MLNSGNGGVGTVRYQWKRDSVTIPGATLASYDAPAANVGDAGSYVCEVSDDSRTLASNPAEVQVADPLAIAVQPLGGNAYAGQSFTLSIYATGGLGALSYQWYKDTVLIAGATNSAIEFDPLVLGDAATYACQVIDARQTIPSTGATLNVASPIQITGQPSGGVRHTGDTFTFSVTASGGYGSRHYQWFQDDQTIPGATSLALNLTPVEPADSGEYRCVVTDDWNSPALSNTAQLTVGDALAIGTPPQSKNGYVGDSHTLTIATTGGIGTVSYQWSKDNVDLPGMTTTALNLSPLDVLDSGSYKCRVHDQLDTITSVAAIVNVAAPISFTQQPQGGSRTAGESHTFNVAVSGGFGALSYQWYKGSSPITGATSPTYAISSLTPLDAGQYRCTATDGWGTALSSDTVQLSVAGAGLYIVQHPQNAGVLLGEPHTFTVVADGGTGTLHYQWKHNGVPVGTDSSNYAIPAVTLPDAGAYLCEVSDDLTTVSSNEATLAVYEGVPAAGAIALLLTAAGLGAAALAIARRRKG